jgi:hypothetical protein
VTLWQLVAVTVKIYSPKWLENAKNSHPAFVGLPFMAPIKVP